LKTFKLADMMKKHPSRVIELAVKGMLPKNHNGRQMLRRLKVYAGNTHPHEAQVAGNANKAEE
jgi:large subunit ribosomal protein L13